MQQHQMASTVQHVDRSRGERLITEKSHYIELKVFTSFSFLL